MSGPGAPRARWRHRLEEHPRAADLLLGTAVVATGWFTAGAADSPMNAADLRTGLLAALPALAVLPLRRRWPVPAGSVLLLSAVLGWVIGGAWSLSALVAGAGVVAAGPRPRHAAVWWPAVAGLLLMTVTVLWPPAGDPGQVDVGAAVVAGAALAVGWGWGAARRRRRLDERELALRAEQITGMRVGMAVTEERRRMAAELHDVVSHTVTVMVNLIDGATAARERAPDAAWDAVGRAGETGRTAVQELTALLAVLRAEEETPLAPTVEPLPEIVDRVRAAGLPVELLVEGEPPQDAPTALVVARVVQEALTNVLKHAGTARARVTVRATGGTVQVTVEDDGDGTGAPGGGSGHGLLGLRERVGRAGGTMTAGATAGGGWRVHAELPVRPAAAREDT